MIVCDKVQHACMRTGPAESTRAKVVQPCSLALPASEKLPLDPAADFGCGEPLCERASLVGGQCATHPLGKGHAAHFESSIAREDPIG